MTTYYGANEIHADRGLERILELAELREVYKVCCSVGEKGRSLRLCLLMVAEVESLSANSLK